MGSTSGLSLPLRLFVPLIAAFVAACSSLSLVSSRGPYDYAFFVPNTNVVMPLVQGLCRQAPDVSSCLLFRTLNVQYPPNLYNDSTLRDMYPKNFTTVDSALYTFTFQCGWCDQVNPATTPAQAKEWLGCSFGTPQEIYVKEGPRMKTCSSCCQSSAWYFHDNLPKPAKLKVYSLSEWDIRNQSQMNEFIDWYAVNKPEDTVIVEVETITTSSWWINGTILIVLLLSFIVFNLYFLYVHNCECVSFKRAIGSCLRLNLYQTVGNQQRVGSPDADDTGNITVEMGPSSSSRGGGSRRGDRDDAVDGEQDELQLEDLRDDEEEEVEMGVEVEEKPKGKQFKSIKTKGGGYGQIQQL